MRSDNRNSQRLNSQVQRRYEQAKPHIEEAAKLYNVDQRYLAGLMYLESLGFNSQATSPTGAAGLGQFVRGTWRSVVRNSSHPELKAIADLSNNQLDLKRYDPKLNAIATAEYVGAGYQSVKRAFARYGIAGEPTAAELYSFHNTGNAAMAVAARRGLTVRQAPIMSLAQKQEAVKNNPGLYDRGIDTLAESYMQRVTQKLENGAAYVTTSNAFSPKKVAQDSEVEQWAVQAARSSGAGQLWVAATSGDPNTLRDYVPGNTADIQQRVMMGQLVVNQGSTTPLTPLSDQEMSDIRAQGGENPNIEQSRMRAIQDMLNPNPHPLLNPSVNILNLDKMRKPGERYYEPVDHAAIDRKKAGAIAAMSWGGGILAGAAATATYKRGGTASQVEGAAATFSLVSPPIVAARLIPRSQISRSPTQQPRSFIQPLIKGFTQSGMLGSSGKNYPTVKMHKDYLDPKYDESKISLGGGMGPVQYLNESQRQAYELFVKDGRLFDATGKIFDSSKAVDTRGNVTGHSMFVMGGDGRVFATNAPREFNFHHSSFLAGQPVATAGELGVVNGRLTYISNKSGHYRPTEQQQNNFIEEMKLRRMQIPDNIKIVTE